jgi:hypothetical protein
MIQFTGATIIDTSFVSNGTKIDLLNNLGTALDNAGWATISGAGTSDWIRETAVTPQGYKFRMEGQDLGGATVSAKFTLRTDTLANTVSMYVLPTNSALYRIWANKYQFFLFKSGTTGGNRDFLCATVPWMPDFVAEVGSPPWAAWMHGSGGSDTDNTSTFTNELRASLRSGILTKCAFIWNNILFGSATNTAGLVGIIMETVNPPSPTAVDDQWEDGTWLLKEPIICKPQGVSTSGQLTRLGQFWDSVVLAKPLDSEVKRTFAGHTWRNITHQYTGSAGQRGSLLLKVP